MNSPTILHAFRIAATILATIGLSTGTVAGATDPRDPWESWNRDVQGFNDGLEKYVMEPVAKGYHWITPRFVDRGITNFFSNIDDIGVFLNDFLQLKPTQGWQDLGRFVVNSTAGIGGFVDVASYIDLFKHKEDFDQTLAVWGVPSGPYLVLPFFGPGTPRGVAGLIGDSATNPVNYIAPMVIPMASGAINVVDQRSDLQSTSKIIDAAAEDRYVFIRNAYFQDRTYKIYDGNPPVDEEQARQEQEMDAELEREERADQKAPR